MEKRNFKENNPSALKIGQKEFSLEEQNIFEIKSEALLLLSNLVRKYYFCHK